MMLPEEKVGLGFGAAGVLINSASVVASLVGASVFPLWLTCACLAVCSYMTAAILRGAGVPWL